MPRPLIYLMLAICVIFGYMKTTKSPSSTSTSTNSAGLIQPSAPTRVVLYGTKQCGYCHQTRELLKNKKIPFLDIDLEENQQGMTDYEKIDGEGVPLIRVVHQQKSDTIIRGYDPDRLLDSLNQQ